MHIIYLHKQFPCGGAEKATMDIANYLCAHGHRVSVLVSRHVPSDYPQGMPRLYDVVQLPEGNLRHSRRVEQFVADFCRKESVDVLVSYRQLLYMGRLKRQTGAKAVYVHHSMPFHELLAIEDQKERSRGLRLFYALGPGWLMEQFYVRKYQSIYRWADAFGVLCQGFWPPFAERLHRSLSDAKMHVLPNCVTLPEHVVREKQRTIVFVGRLTHRDKRVDRLLRIWKTATPQLPEWTLKIVGDGKERANLEQMAAELSLERVCFEGFSADVKRYYDEASVLCMTSTFEGWPLSVAEAQANGVVPVLFNSFAGAEDLVAHAMEGVLIAPFDEAAYSAALVDLCADEPRLKAMQEAVLRKAQHYTIERTGQAWTEMLDRLTDR